MPPTLFQDSSSWSEVNSFETSENTDSSNSSSPSGQDSEPPEEMGSLCGPGAVPDTDTGKTMLCMGSPTSPSSLDCSKCSQSPLIVLCKKRGRLSCLTGGESGLSPIKSLPFSPSQVDDDFCKMITTSHQRINSIESKCLETMTNSSHTH